MKEKILYIGMKYDYGNKVRGLSFEHRNFYYSLKNYCKSYNWNFIHYDFIERGSQIGVDLMTEELFDLAKKEHPALLFAVLFEFSSDPKHEVFKRISELGIKTIHWFCDDHWRFEKYSSLVAPSFDFVCTTANSALPKYNRLGISDRVIKTQWGCNHQLYTPMDIEKDIDISFVGQPHGNRREILSHISNKGFELKVYGFNWEQFPRVPFHQMVRIFSRSKINLNLSNSSTMIGQQIKGRNFEIPGTRSFLLTDNAENLGEYYLDGKEIVIFNSVDEMIEKIKYYLNHEKQRELIAESSYKRTLSEHTWFHRYDEIFSRVGIKQKEKTPIHGKKFKRDVNSKKQSDSAEPFTVILANFNGGKYIETAIASLLNQSSENWNLIIVDDASSDDSILKIGKFLFDKRIRFIRHEVNKGYTVALKTAIASIETGIFGLLDSDDALAPNAIEVMRKAHLDNPKCGLIYSQFAYCDENLKPKKVGYCKEIPENKSNLDTNGVSHFKTFKINYYLKTTGYDESILYSEDKDISYKIEEVAGLKFIDKILYFYRTLSNSVSHINENRELSFETMMKAKSNAIKRRIENSVIANREALDLFKKGLDYLYNLEFSKATEIIKEYRTKINYNSFVKYCNSEINNPSLSIIIVAFNTNQLLIDCIESLKNQDNKNFEIIVVDNGQNEQVLEKLLSYQILYIRNPYNFILSEGRNIGTHFAKAKIISFLDDDAVVPDNYVSSILKAFQLPDVLAIRGKVLPKNSSLKIPESYDLGDKPVPSCITAEGNSAYLKEVYLRLNGMNPLLFGHEGLDFSYRLFETDQKIHSFYWPDTIIFHNPADEYKNELKSQRYEIMNSFLVWLHPNIWQFHELLNRYTSNNITMPAVLIDQRSEVPVVLITYNRPNHTKKVLESLRVNNIKNLFIFSDAPKEEKDVEAVKQTRELFNSIDWTVPNITFQNINQGLAKSITNAVDTVFKKFDKVILLEDDCVPQEYFFEFMYDCLNEYQHNERVFGISGYTVPLSDDLLEDYKSDVYFFPRIGSWGWATWKNKWQKKENDLNNLLIRLKDEQIDITQGGNDVSLILAGMLNGSVKDVWTINWLLTVYLYKGYYVYPAKSHIANIGMDGTGIHCGKTDKYETNLADKPPVEFPPEIIIDERINQAFRKYYDVNISEDQVSSIKSKGLKVVHLCSQDFGGAGKAAYRLHKGLQSIGVNSIFITVNKQSGDPSVKVIPDQTSNEVKECINPATYQSVLMNENYARWWGQLGVYLQRSKSIELFTDTVAPFKLNLIKEISEADVINLHWTSGMLDFENLAATFKGKNIVWTLHDMNSFTGGCHYNQGCQKFKTGCGNCPLLNSGIENDLSKRIFSIKEKSYKNLDIQIVTPSKWLGETAQESFLFSKFAVYVIPYGLPTDTFAAGSKDDIKKKIGIPPQYKVILFGADNLGNERKGFAYLLKALEKLKTKDDFILATFGNLPSEIKLNGKFKVITFGSIPGENELAMIYNAADVFVLPSLEDNLPNTVLESLSCGTPVVAFNIGGIPDMIRHKKTGYLAEYKNPQSLAEGISWIINNKNLKDISHDCRKEALEKYPLELQAKNYLTIYQKLTRSNQAKPVKTLPANDHELQSNNGIKVSAIVSTYNSEKYIRGCLDDLLCQTLYQKGELEIVVVNSGSTQNEELIVNEYKDKYKNIKYLKTERETVYQAWNRGIKLASGKYLTNANTDDRHRKDSLEILVRELDANVKVGLVYADQYVTKTENQTFDEHNVVGQFDWPEFDSTQLIHCACIGPQPMWKKSLHESFGYFSETLKVAGDYDWWLRISEKVKLKHIPEKLGLYLLSDNSIEHNLTDSMVKETVEIRKHYAIKAGLKNLDYNKYQSTFLVLTGKKHPLVSIIITTYNRPDDLKEQSRVFLIKLTKTLN